MESGLKLLPCPFCGGAPEIIIDTDDDGRFAAVACPKCGAGSRQHYFCGDDARDYAASAWNARAPSDAALVEALEGLTGALKPLMDDDTILMDCVDNHARPYTSQWLADQLSTLSQAYDAALAAAKGQQP